MLINDYDIGVQVVLFCPLACHDKAGDAGMDPWVL